MFVTMGEVSDLLLRQGVRFVTNGDVLDLLLRVRCQICY